MKKILLVTIALSAMLLADFSRNNGVVTDNKTGLQWQDDYSDNGGDIKSAKWTDAIAYCESLSLGDHDDWRLPNIYELRSIADRSRHDSAIDPAFQHVASDGYWSSTTRADRTDYAWFVGFWSGGSNGYGKSHSNHVRCVRGGQ